ncbi:hypothetical protein DV515_00006651 [Chloebia gouldiae]|uniref:Uncharacterized protein n=1 Tax=Chloebia gouldiae TaxID=44316 RepID=A0A3L8SKC8_CHLGU|nr:hypothetical protein DV515_00006651 [Chloebia gouldiae]
MGSNDSCLLLTADPVFPRGFGAVLSFAPCLELQQLSLLGQRSAVSLDGSWEWSRSALIPVMQHSLSLCSYPVPLPGTTSSWEVPPEWSRPSQGLPATGSVKSPGIAAEACLDCFVSLDLWETSTAGEKQ